MNTILLILVLATLTWLLVSYVRRDRFAGPSASTHLFDELGHVDERRHFVPRG
jgi:hypothetical protein